MLYNHNIIRLTYSRANTGHAFCADEAFVLGQIGLSSAVDNYPSNKQVKQWQVQVFYTKDFNDYPWDDHYAARANASGEMKRDVKLLYKMPGITSFQLSFDTLNTTCTSEALSNGLRTTPAHFGALRVKSCNIDIPHAPVFVARLHAAITDNAPAFTIIELANYCADYHKELIESSIEDWPSRDMGHYDTFLLLEELVDSEHEDDTKSAQSTA